MSKRKYRYLAIDWSGAKEKGLTRKQIAVAVLEPQTCSPRLLPMPDRGYWTRTDILKLLQEEAEEGTPTVAGIDCAFAFPHVDCGCYIRNFKSATVLDFWTYVKGFCDKSLYAGSFVEDKKHKDQFWQTSKNELKPKNMKVRYRETEFAAMIYGATPESVFRLSPNTQVGKGSLSGMGLLHELTQGDDKKHKIAVWPFDKSTREANNSKMTADLTMVEIYPAVFLLQATGKTGKIKTDKKNKKKTHNAAMQELNNALGKFGFEPAEGVSEPLTDDMSDALVSVAGMAHMVEGRGGVGNIWNPPEGSESEASDRILETEGWIFGVPWPDRSC